MNQRIKELAEQAGFVPGVMGLNRYTDFDPEKFAELIVQECVDICYETTGNSYLNGIAAGTKIMQRFGVER